MQRSVHTHTDSVFDLSQQKGARPARFSPGRDRGTTSFFSGKIQKINGARSTNKQLIRIDFMDFCFSRSPADNTCGVQLRKLSYFDFPKQRFLNHYFICNLFCISTWPGDILAQDQLCRSSFKSQFSFTRAKGRGAFFHFFLITFLILALI